MIAEIADEKKGEDILLLEVRGLCNFTDFFVLVTAESRPLRNSILHEVESRLRAGGERPYGAEGLESSQWAVMDFGDVVLHVFNREARDYYGLERLWGDARHLAWQGAHPAA